ncbi:hypothetical protein [Phytohabitans rumicis]|uniref:Uncharacterized protein n=1 Tax=Phytohabitans rumicis TaxID=1076125 RepID=A0A6V8LKZ2_9ACTN|nr:hypothetical protein [Phytohabitans rumicis]GFJ96240.1 hypothetical protein Prum_098820 [Phytohabitans rumicis]
MNPEPGLLAQAGAVCFGLVIGYLTYRTLARNTERAAIGDLASVVGVVGGAAVTGLFEPGTELFGLYAIGLLAGMVAFFVLYGALNGFRAKRAGTDAGPRWPR